MSGRPIQASDFSSPPSGLINGLNHLQTQGRHPTRALRRPIFEAGEALAGELEFLRLGRQRGGSGRNFGIPIHNFWDETSRNLWDSRITYGTAPQS
jgi:hypothetical protein